MKETVARWSRHTVVGGLWDCQYYGPIHQIALTAANVTQDYIGSYLGLCIVPRPLSTCQGSVPGSKGIVGRTPDQASVSSVLRVPGVLSSTVSISSVVGTRGLLRRILHHQKLCQA